MQKNDYHVGLYLRLSKDDMQQGESIRQGTVLCLDKHTGI